MWDVFLPNDVQEADQCIFGSFLGEKKAKYWFCMYRVIDKSYDQGAEKKIELLLFWQIVMTWKAKSF